MKKITQTIVKTRHALSIIVMATIMIASYTVNAQIAINTDSSNAESSAILEVKSTVKGFLPPRLTAAQRDAISSPAAGLIIYCTDNKEVEMYNGTEWKNMAGGPTTTFNPTTGKIWMDHNLGASRVATSSTDTASYGDLYQWGRGTDGHQVRTSGTTSSLSSTDDPGHGDFILNNSSSTYYDWRSPQNNNLWQGVSGINNPCPSGFRLPTEAEWVDEIGTWSSNNAAGAFASPLKLPVAGFRNYSFGALSLVGSYGYYWSSTVVGTASQHLNFNSSNAFMESSSRAHGYSVRCIKE